MGGLIQPVYLLQPVFHHLSCPNPRKERPSRRSISEDDLYLMQTPDHTTGVYVPWHSYYPLACPRVASRLRHDDASPQTASNACTNRLTTTHIQNNIRHQTTHPPLAPTNAPSYSNSPPPVQSMHEHHLLDPVHKDAANGFPNAYQMRGPRWQSLRRIHTCYLCKNMMARIAPTLLRCLPKVPP